MKTYYIPTSSLNFNNILSSESVSPKDFYHNRSFGYSRWASIPENPFNYSIVLYDQIGFFDRPKSDYEDHPLLIEVLLDEVQESQLTSVGDHAFVYDRTIYLDPFSTRILFFSENARRIALSLSDSSIETKFVRLYQKKILVISRPPFVYPTLDSSSEKQAFNSDEMERDKRVNRMKGLLYGYYIGGLLSASRDDVVQLNTLCEIQNILAAILASFEHKATIQQRERLKELYSSLQPEIPFFTKLSGLVSEKSLFDAIVSLVRGEYGYIRGEFDADRKISQLLTAPQEGINPVMKEINGQIRQAEISMANKVLPVSVLDGELVLGEGFLPNLNLKTVSAEEKTLYKAWVSEVLSKDEYTGKISTFKGALSDDVTRKAKEVCETEWKGSYPEITLNALRRHVRGDEFNHIWNNDVLSSLAAVIIRGDDWQKLLQFMQEKVMTDYRVAFSMYGTINGFANLPRDFTDVLFCRDSRYIASVYREIYGQLFGKDILTPSKSDTIQVQTPQAPILEDMPDFTSATNKVEDLPESIPITTDSKSPEGFDSLMSEIVTKCSGAKKDERIYKELYVKHGGMTEAFAEAVRTDTSLNRGKGAQQGVRQFLLKKIKPTKETKPKKKPVDSAAPARTETSLFADSYQSTGYFLTDFDYLSNNSEFIAIVSRARQKWIEDLKWFIEAHNPETTDSYYKGKPVDNKTVINQFISLKKGIYRSTKDFLFKTYSING